MPKFEKDMQDPALETQLNDAIKLAQKIPPLSGTPFFVINQEYIAGANTEALEAMLQKALKDS